MTAAEVAQQPRDITLEDVTLTLVADPQVEIRSALRTSMEHLGQRVSVKLRRRAPKKKGDPPRYEIVDGKHRIAVAKDLEWETIRAEVEAIGHSQGDRHDRAMETLVTNVQRERNLGAEAEAVDILLGSGKFTTDEISKRTGVTLRIVKELQAMKKGLVPQVFDRVKSGEIARGAALKMLRLDEGRQTALAAEMDGEKTVTLKDAEEAVKDQRMDMLDQLDKVRPQPAQEHTQLGHMIQMVASMYSDAKKKTLLDAAAILRGE